MCDISTTEERFIIYKGNRRGTRSPRQADNTQKKRAVMRGRTRLSCKKLQRVMKRKNTLSGTRGEEEGRLKRKPHYREAGSSRV